MQNMAQHPGTSDESQQAREAPPSTQNRDGDSRAAAARDAEHGRDGVTDRVFTRRIDCAPGRGVRSWPGGRHR
jgi:hypothetical protein